MLVEILVEITDERQAYFPAEIHDLDEVKAARWIQQGFVQAVSEADVEPETATLEAGDEQAVRPRRGRRKRAP